MSGPVDDQLTTVRRLWPQALARPLLDGTTLVTIPDVPLPTGWSHSAATVSFVVPTGYPVAKPDCFYADVGLRLAHGAMPQSSQLNHLPGTNEPRLWFSWHVALWNPTTDSLLTYVRVIQRRLAEVR